MAQATIFIALLAGLVSFLSPCVLPIIPGFLAYLAGSSLSEAEVNRKKIFLNSVFFVLGFSVIFALLGVILNTILIRVAYDAQTWLARIGGLAIIFFGLYLVGLIKIPYLERAHKINVSRKFESRYITSFVFGAAFAAGWTPCVGAVLGGLLALTAVQPGAAFGLLLAYAIGLGVPFLIVGAFASQSANFIKSHGKAFEYIKIIFGIVLIILGVLAFTQNLSRIANLSLLNKILLK